MAPSRALQRAVKQRQYVRAAELALESRANREFLLKLHDADFWKRVSRDCFGRDRFLDAFCDKIDWDVVSASPLTVATAKAFANRLNWELVSRQPFLRQEFIYEMGERLDLRVISANYNNLSLAVQQRHAAALDWRRVVLSHTMIDEWFQSPIAEHIDFKLVAKHKRLNRAHFGAPHCMSKIDLTTYMSDPRKISDALILHCLREGRAELRAAAAAVPWADHMRVFDKYPALADTLREWGVPAWSAASAPPAYYMRPLPAAFERDFVRTGYWDKFVSYATVTTSDASATFALMVFDNFKSHVDWDQLQAAGRFVNLPVLFRANEPIVTLGASDEQVRAAYGRFVGAGADGEHIIPMHMSVRDAYFKRRLVQPCASQCEHDKARACERVLDLNGGEALLNWNLLSATQPVCPFNQRQLQNANAQTYHRDNPHFVQQVYEMMIAAQMNIN
ncbi:unknown [Antheraea pernyi nucleopolyhedrovirus]|uniref:Uncharacterized protein n=2 Tax=Antheraea pernyi nuclear polyhedrosis virus TaxID=161494 RepID=Q1HGY4_NPVAP|nr:hypothetical protein APNV_p115 [Antheraea pernyi nucleopolyhedrovirus]AWD33636.1 hypothetical protein [Antheraea proylei nucleopolyhedrovirus]BBD50575.1 hypothetical protein [Antheraea yamamai nucleopolyhedrovirus]BBD50727.1 hypothetical protein [Samia cynthia nucleopolyhedrovirus]ABF50348.1 unknown [Antheraea pernyi nucleopolyhedrovirus]ABQ12344.1 unknown [Antheraea pernyi nucleopolyhedrovirus]